VIDQVISEPLGGAHHDYQTAAENLKKAIVAQMTELMKLSPEQVRKDRQDKFRRFGSFR
jgi:acetyl-CoA carboxylase carboxyl transferase subunit alpha